MTIGKKLDTFRIRDRFKLSEAEILTEAKLAAERRASLAGWTVSKVMPSVVPPTEEENFICYSFDIYGVECQQESLEQDGMEPTIFSSNESKQAAKPDSAS